MNEPLYFANPDDGTDTYAYIEIHHSTDSYASVLALVDINITTRSEFSSGYTEYVDISGDSAKSYKARFKDLLGNWSEYSDVYLTGTSYAMVQVRNTLRDAAKTVFSDLELRDKENVSVKSLFPSILKGETDTSLTITTQIIDYSLPVGVFRIKQVFRGSVADSTWAEIDNFDFVNGQILRLQTSDVGTAYPLTIYYSRAFRNAGEVPLLLQPILINDMLAQCYEQLATDRGIKFQAYAAQTRDSDVRPETLSALATRYRDLAKTLRDRAERG